MTKEGTDLPTGLSKPALRALATAGISKLEQFAKVREEEVSEWHGVGPKAMELIRKALKEKGFTFAQDS